MSTLPGTLKIELTNEARRPVGLTPLRRVALRAGNVLRLPARSSVHVALVTSRRMQVLNRRTRGMNQPTDVLSFPLRSHREFRRGKRDPDGVFRLGDIVIAIDMVKRQARENGVPLPRELSDLFAHGLLHIAGHHHDTRAEARRTAALAEKLVEGRFDR